MSWYYRTGGSTQGPIERDGLTHLLRTGVLTPQVEVSENQETWAIAALVPGLMAEVHGAPAPTPPQNSPTPPQNSPTPPQSSPTPPQNSPTPPQDSLTPPQNSPTPPTPVQPGTSIAGPTTAIPGPPAAVPDPPTTVPDPPAAVPDPPINSVTDNTEPAPPEEPKTSSASTEEPTPPLDNAGSASVVQTPSAPAIATPLSIAAPTGTPPDTPAPEPVETPSASDSQLRRESEAPGTDPPAGAPPAESPASPVPTGPVGHIVLNPDARKKTKSGPKPTSGLKLAFCGVLSLLAVTAIGLFAAYKLFGFDPRPATTDRSVSKFMLENPELIMHANIAEIVESDVYEKARRLPELQSNPALSYLHDIEEITLVTDSFELADPRLLAIIKLKRDYRPEFLANMFRNGTTETIGSYSMHSDPQGLGGMAIGACLPEPRTVLVGNPYVVKMVLTRDKHPKLIPARERAHRRDDPRHQHHEHRALRRLVQAEGQRGQEEC